MSVSRVREEPHARFDAAAGGNPGTSRQRRAVRLASRRPYKATLVSGSNLGAEPGPPASRDSAAALPRTVAIAGRRGPVQRIAPHRSDDDMTVGVAARCRRTRDYKQE